MRLLHSAVCAAALMAASLSAALADSATIKVGTIFPLSGGAGPQGQHVTDAINAMAAMINDNGGVLGRKLEVLSRDDQSTPAVGVSRADDLISQGVSVIIEGWNSPVTLAEQPLISRAGITDITAISKADQILLGKGNPLPVRLNSSNAQDGAVIAKYIAKSGKTKIAFLTENDAYGNGAQQSIEDQLKSLGYAYTKVAEEKFPFPEADFRVSLTNVKSANPDIIVAIDANEGLGLPALMREARESRLSAELVTAVGTVAPSVISVAGPAANGVIGADIYFPDVEPFKSNPDNQEFIKRTEKMFNYDPDKFMALGAASLEVWAKAANEVKSLDKDKVTAKIRGGSFKNTVFGDVTFQPNGQMNSDYSLFVVKDQKIEILPNK